MLVVLPLPSEDNDGILIQHADIILCYLCDK